jgi:hypothetical protein
LKLIENIQRKMSIWQQKSRKGDVLKEKGREMMMRRRRFWKMQILEVGVVSG